MRRELFIRVDGNTKQGLGHLIRCCSLASMLEEDWQIHFFCKSIPVNIAMDIEERGWRVTCLRSEEDFYTKLRSEHVVVLDGYHFSSSYQQSIRSQISKLVCIDDLQSGHYSADLIINHGPTVTPETYSAELHTQYALGPDYALLRPEFLQPFRRKQSEESPSNIFICFGGSDQENFTGKILSWIPFSELAVTVVTGSAFTRDEELAVAIKKRADLQIHVRKQVNALEMRSLMLNSDLGIVPSSGILYEALALKLPVVTGFYVENQQQVYRGFVREEGVFGANSFGKVDFLNAMEQCLEALQKGVSIDVIDQKSGQRIRGAFRNFILAEDLTVRRASPKDVKLYYDWVNDPITRRSSFNSDRIEWDTHITWYQSKIKSEDTIMYLFERGESCVGQVRFEQKQGEWYINISVDREYRGSGNGFLIMQKALEQLAHDEGRSKPIVVVGLVKSDNKSSSRILKKLGFNESTLADGTLKFQKTFSTSSYEGYIDSGSQDR